MSTASDRWQQLQSLFDELLELGGTARQARLAALELSDPSVGRELRSLLGAHDRAGDFLQLLDRPGRDAPAERVLAPTGEGERREGSYTLLREIGRGGMGEVYLAHDPRLDRRVALKLLHEELRTDADRKARFLAEARAAAALDHPNVGTVYEIGETSGGGLFIAMAYYDGDTLRERIARGALPPEEAARVATQVAEGLRAAHARGIVHRDIKPANVLLTRDGTAKIVDFGIAKIDGALRTRPGEVMGTLAYMAPEQARGDAVDARTDLWSLGVLLHEMLTGARPFGGESPAAILHAILAEPPAPLPASVPPGLRRVVARLLAREPADRHADADALLADLARWREPADEPEHDADAGRPSPNAGALPEPLTRFIGRERELARIRDALPSARLLTLTGPGGAGKTRLALRVAAGAAPDFPDGVRFVSLAPVADAALVPQTVAQALGVRETGDVPVAERLEGYVRGKRMLLVLDNCEHVLGAAPLVLRLLTASPSLAVLATSRAPLGVQGERELPVPPLALPDLRRLPEAERLATCESVALFVERAQAVRPDFALSPENAAAVAEICVRLDGMPLAIELAAARSRLLSPRAILGRLGQRLDLLRSDARDLPERHRTLREVIGWSYGLLGPEERALVGRASVFAGGFTLSEAEALWREMGAPDADVLEHLAALVNHNLLRQEEQADGEPRFFMLETIREFGRERLRADDEEDAARGAHLAVFLRAAEEAAPHLRGPGQVQWFERLEREHDNLRAAVDYALESRRTAEALRLGEALARFWIARGFLSEGRERLEQIVGAAGPHADPAARARLLVSAGFVLSNQGGPREVWGRFEEALRLFREAGDLGGQAVVLNHQSWLAYLRGDDELAVSLAREALAIHESRGDVRGVALAHNNLGWVHLYHRGDVRAARVHIEESLRGQRALGDPRGISFALTTLAAVELWTGHAERAVAAVDESVEHIRAAGDPMYGGAMTVWQAFIAYETGGPHDPEALVHAVLPDLRALGHRWAIGFALRTLADVARDRGEHDAARALYDESLAHYRQIGGPAPVVQVLCRMAEAARRRGDGDAALAHLAEASRIARRLGNPILLADCAECEARVRLDLGDRAAAAQLLAAAARARADAGVPLSPRDAALHEATMRELTADG